MPELPEVQTTVQGLQILLNKKITNIKIYSTKLRYKIPKNIQKILKSRKIVKIYRIGKYIIVNSKNHFSLIFHLGMSGRLRILKQSKFIKKKHDHFILMTEKYILIFNDARKFGFIDLLKTKEIFKTYYISRLGLDALDRKLNERYLRKNICKSIVPIKQILLNQEIIAGIGNIYANEILYDAKISPFTKGCSLTILEIKKIIKSIKKILRIAINSGGSTLKDYVSVDGTVGTFQNNFKVYNRYGQKILGYKIKRIKQYNRSTFYCPDVQLMSKKTERRPKE
jgi:formamidopyrimidine-DNA glycosylase